jgi:hypothetical protein
MSRKSVFSCLATYIQDDPLRLTDRGVEQSWDAKGLEMPRRGIIVAVILFFEWASILGVV